MMKQICYFFGFLLFVSCASASSDDMHREGISSKSSSVGNEALYLETIQSPQLCHGTDCIQSSALRYRVISSGSSPILFSPTVIRDSAALKSFYKKVFNREAQLPFVDFAKEALIAVCAGSCNTGGYSVALVKAIESKGIIQLHFALQSPPPSTIVTQAFTKPYTIIAMEAHPQQNIHVEIQSQKHDKARLLLQ